MERGLLRDHNPDGAFIMPSMMIQARFGETEYALGRLVLDRAKALRLARSDLVRRLGYENLNAGHAALSELLLRGTQSATIAPRLAEALEIEPNLLDQVSIATAHQQHDEHRARILERERAYRAAFRPHLQVQTERKVPSPIFVAALLGTARLRIVPLTDEPFASDENVRDRAVKAVIVEHHREHAGRVPAFGAITGYVLVLIPGYDGLDFGLPFSVSGDREGPWCSVRRLPKALLGKRRPDGRLNVLLRLPRLGDRNASR
jgi:hypothetical protein